MYDHRQFFPGFPGGPGGPGGGQGFPGFPGGGQGAPSSPPPGGQQGGGGQPPGPPPSYQPQKTNVTSAAPQGAGGPSLYAVDPGSIRGCLYRNTYIWLRRDSFWFYPTYVGRRSVSGWRWIGYAWVYYGIDLKKIESFTCV